jgi:hypothetical protein
VAFAQPKTGMTLSTGVGCYNPLKAAKSDKELQNASYLTEEQKKNILHNNSARFLRLETGAEI